MRGWSLVLVSLLTVGCSRGAAESVAPTTEPEPEQQLEALIIDDAPTMVAVSAACPFDEGSVPELASFDDSHLPEVDRSRSRASNMNKGEERLNDVQLYEQMLPLQEEIFRCIDVASCFSDEDLGAVELSFDFELGSDGKVRAATVRPSVDAANSPLVPCARNALASLEFTAYDGGSMFVNYALTVE